MRCRWLLAGWLLAGSFVFHTHPVHAAGQASFSSTITGSDTPGGIANGDTVTLTIVIKNSGGIGSYQAELDIPDAYDFLDNNACGGTVVYNVDPPMNRIGLIWPNGTGSLGTLGTATCSVSLRANTVTSNDVATVSAYRGPVSGGTLTGTTNYTFTRFVAMADMQISASANKSSLAIGDSADFTFTATNNGPQAASGAGAGLVFPTTFTVTPKSCTGASTLNGTSISWNIGSLAAGASATCVMTGAPQSGAGSNAAVTASVSASQSDPNSANNNASTSVAVVAAQADVRATIGANVSQAKRGDVVTFTLGVSNAGPQDATSTQVSATFPAQLSVADSSCSAAANTLTWAVGTVAAGGNASCTVHAAVIDDSVASVAVHSQASAALSDPDTSNNAANYTLQIMPPTPQTTDLALTLTASPMQLTPGDAVTYTLKASNLGTVAATSTQVSAQFPAQLQLAASACGATPGNQLTWNIGTLAAGANQTCTVSGTLGATMAASISASASVSSAITDSSPQNNTASVAVTVQQQTGGGGAADIAIHLGGVVAGHSYTPGDVLQVTATVDNSGSSAATGATAVLHVPDIKTLSGVSASCGSFSADGNVEWTIGTLTGNSSETCSIRATVAGQPRTLTVSALLSADNPASLDQLADALLVAVRARPKQVSVIPGGLATAANSTHIVLSNAASRSVFQSRETRLLGGNQNAGGQDIYRADADGSLKLENIDQAGLPLSGTASLPAISGDGGTIAFNFTSAKSLAAKDLISGEMWAGGAGQPKHRTDTGMNGAAPNGSANGAPSVSSTSGTTKMVFCSAASNLVAGDSNGGNDVFLVDPTNASSAAQRVSTDEQGNQLAGDSCEPKISADGRKVVFTISSPTRYGTAARQVVSKDLVSGALTLISSTGDSANADNSEPTINADGSVIAFTSQASNLDGLGAPVGGQEVFVSIAQGSGRLIKRARSGDGAVPNGASQHPQLSGDGSVLVMQTLASNFFGTAKALGTPACGSVAITTNYFSPASLGSALCGGQNSNQNPSISGDGSTVGFDSNAPQSGTNSSNSNTYLQGLAQLDALGTPNFGDDFSGQWYDPSQSGHGLVVDVLPPAGNGSRIVNVIWFVYANGHPTWLIGSATAQAGTGADAGKVIVPIDKVGLFSGRSFPIGEDNAQAQAWGSMQLTFADANTGVMSWTSTRAGFNSGTMPIMHFQPVRLPKDDAAGAGIKACYSGNWKEPSKSGHGFEFEVTSPGSTPTLFVDWFAFAPDGSPVWLYGGGTINGSSVTMSLDLIDGSGAQFPPLFDRPHLTEHVWGTATFTFSDAVHAHMTWNSSLPGYGQGSIDLVPTFKLDRRSCN